MAHTYDGRVAERKIRATLRISGRERRGATLPRGEALSAFFLALDGQRGSVRCRDGPLRDRRLIVHRSPTPSADRRHSRGGGPTYVMTPLDETGLVGLDEAGRGVRRAWRDEAGEVELVVAG